MSHLKKKTALASLSSQWIEVDTNIAIQDQRINKLTVASRNLRVTPSISRTCISFFFFCKLIKLSLNIFIENRINIYISKYVYYKLYINSNNDTYLVLEILVLQYRLDERVWQYSSSWVQDKMAVRSSQNLLQAIGARIYQINRVQENPNQTFGVQTQIRSSRLWLHHKWTESSICMVIFNKMPCSLHGEPSSWHQRS